MSAPVVSVILPARNAESTVGNAIASVLEQTMPDLELIVVDDASADRTAAVVSAMRDRRVRLLRCERNIRYAAARNLGLRHARGQWAAFLDADDEWAPERMEWLLDAAHGDQGCYVADLELSAVPGPSGRLLRAVAPRQIENGSITEIDLDAALALGHDVRPMIPIPAFRCNGLEFPEWGSCGEWTFLLVRLSAQGIRGRLVRRAGYFYRAQAAHDSSTLQGKRELARVLEVLTADPSLPKATQKQLSRKLAQARQGLLAGSLRHGDAGAFLRYSRSYPETLWHLPMRILLFAAAKARSFLVTAAISRGIDPAIRG
jgi:succinoglycan biosynthesis protein ExoO